MTADDLGEVLKLIANLLLLAIWVWRHRPQQP
jgi:hypothetical protein